MNYNYGIYKIENLVNEKCYIGQTLDLNKRKWRHFNNLENNIGDNIHLQNAYNKYGKINFKFSVLLYCEKFELTKYENFFDNYYKELNLSYNIRKCVDTNKGIILSEETKRKISKATKGENNPFYGKRHSEETKRKMSLNHADMSGKNNPFFGKHHSEETRKELSETNKGKSISEEARKARIGKHFSNITIEKMKISRLGKKCSDETKRKISLKVRCLSVENVLEIRKMINENIRQIDIAKKFNVNQGTISNIKLEKFYKEKIYY
jgi:hypothetical protein